jgi:hypothetical protein
MMWTPHTLRIPVISAGSPATRMAWEMPRCERSGGIRFGAEEF